MDMNEIVKRCKQGNEEAWNMMINKYSKTIYNIALNFANNREDASDITQDVFIKIYNNMNKFVENKSFYAWILKITKNHCIDYWRKNKKYLNKSEMNENIIFEHQTPEDCSTREFDLLTLRKKLLILEPELRLILIMRDIQGFSYNEISENLSIPMGTVKSRINRARIKLAGIFLNEEK
jgi:RNA polymerase sigma-70 factor (ECF subfamily)